MDSAIQAGIIHSVPEESKVPREVFLFCWNRTLKVYGEFMQFT